MQLTSSIEVNLKLFFESPFLNDKLNFLVQLW